MTKDHGYGSIAVSVGQMFASSVQPFTRFNEPCCLPYLPSSVFLLWSCLSSVFCGIQSLVSWVVSSSLLSSSGPGLRVPLTHELLSHHHMVVVLPSSVFIAVVLTELSGCLKDNGAPTV